MTAAISKKVKNQFSQIILFVGLFVIFRIQAVLYVGWVQRRDQRSGTGGIYPKLILGFPLKRKRE